MSERLTDDWALYEIASNLERWERLLDIRFSIKERGCLQMYLAVYEELLDLHTEVLEMDESSVDRKSLQQKLDTLEYEVEYLLQTDTLQKILNYRCGKKQKGRAKWRKRTTPTVSYFEKIMLVIVLSMVVVLAIYAVVSAILSK